MGLVDGCLKETLTEPGKYFVNFFLACRHVLHVVSFAKFVYSSLFILLKKCHICKD